MFAAAKLYKLTACQPDLRYFRFQKLIPMSRLISMAGSNSSTSINYKLVQFTESLIQGHSIDSRDMAGFEIPMYSADLESKRGIPEVISKFYEELKDADGLILSVNEYNGNPSAFTKNLLDWLSRKEREYLKDCPVFLMSTSPGRGAAKSSRKVVEDMLQHFGARVVSRFSLPSFKHTFEEGQGITDTELREEHARALAEFLSVLD